MLKTIEGSPTHRGSSFGNDPKKASLPMKKECITIVLWKKRALPTHGGRSGFMVWEKATLSMKEALAKIVVRKKSPIEKIVKEIG